MLVHVDITVNKQLADAADSVAIQCLVFLKQSCFAVSRRGDLGRGHHNIDGAVSIFFQVSLVPSHIHSPSKTTVQTCAVENHSIFNVVPCKTHDCNLSVLSRGKFIEVAYLDSACFDHGLLGVSHQVKQGVDSVHLIVAYRPNCLLAHRTLVSVSGRLVVMGIRDQPSDNSQNSKRINFHVGGRWLQVWLSKSNQGIVFFVHIEVLNDTLTDKVRKIFQTDSQVMDVVLGQHGYASLAHNQRPY